MSGDRRRAGTARLIALIVMLLLCMWLLYRMFVAVPAAPPPKIRAADQHLYANSDIPLPANMSPLTHVLPVRLNCDI